MLKLKLFLGILMTYHAFNVADEAQIVKLIPPTLTTETILQEIVCQRPVRDAGVNISLETIANNGNKKIIVNCYGHGGSGWVTLFGSVQKAIELFEREGTSKENSIKIVGSGCMGLTLAIELSRLGYHVAGITTDNLYNGASWKASGSFAMIPGNYSQAKRAEVIEMAVATFLVFQKIEKGEHPYINKHDTVRFMPFYCDLENSKELEFLEVRKLIPPKVFVTLDFGNDVSHPNFVKYMTFFMNTGIIMEQLLAEVKKLNIPIEIKKIASFAEVKENIVFNCTGVGASELNGDKNLQPVIGHMLALNAKSGKGHMDYMILATVKQNGKDEWVYYSPKNLLVTPEHPEGRQCFGVVGATYIPMKEGMSQEEAKKLNQVEFQKLLERVSLFYTGK